MADIAIQTREYKNIQITHTHTSKLAYKPTMKRPPPFLYLEHCGFEKHAVNYNLREHARTMYVIKSLDAALFTFKSAQCWMPASL